MSLSTSAPSRRGPDPRLAAALSIVPGLGQVVERQPRKALHYFTWSVVLVAGAVLLMSWAVGFGHDLMASGAIAAALLLALGMIVVFLGLFISGLYVWASSAVDAYASARELREHGTTSPARRYFHL
jgi:hypothetical protein